MKCAVAFFLLLAGCGVALGDSPGPVRPPRRAAPLLEELVQMTRAGASEATVLAYARAHRIELPPELSDTSLLWLHESGVGPTVVSYMAAIDVRASRSTMPEGVTDASAMRADAARSRDAYASEGGGESSGDDDRDADAETDGGISAYPYTDANDSGLYADSDSGGFPYASSYWDSDLFFGDPYFSFPAFVFVDHGRFLRRFPHRDGRDHRFEGGSRGRRHDGGDFREAWRERGPRGNRDGSMAAGNRNSMRPAFARRGFGPGARGVRGRSIGLSGFRAPHGRTGSFSGPRSRGPSGFAGSPRSGGFRGAIGMSGGGRAASGPRGGRGMR